MKQRKSSLTLGPRVQPQIHPHWAREGAPKDLPWLDLPNFRTVGSQPMPRASAGAEVQQLTFHAQQ